MLGWIFTKKNTGAGPATAVAAPSSAKNKAPNAPAATPAPAAVLAVDWPAALAQALGDDEALLALLRTAGAPLQAKQAAVEALEGEAALKRAEHEFRSHDRRIHQLAKRRLLEQVAQRQTGEKAARLIELAQGLVAESNVPLNRGVELDRAWQALDAAAIGPTQRDTFAALTAQLAAHMRQCAEVEQQRKRWHHDAVQATRQLRSTCTDAAAGTQDRAALAGAVDLASGVVERVPPSAAGDAALTDLYAVLLIAATLDGHLAVLEPLLAGLGHGAEAEPAVPLPPLQDAPLAALLEARHARWQQARKQARHEQVSQRRDEARERQRARKGEHDAALADCVAQAEAALDAAQLADAYRLLNEIDATVQGGAVPDALLARIAGAQAKLAQLRGWQHWAGERARDEIVLQAEALAAATVASGAAPEEASEAEAEVARLSIRQRADVIATLRARWKEIDRVGGAGSRALWQRFNAALKAAHAPVDAHVAAQRAARESNLATRLQLLEGLEAEQAADTRALATSLDRFHVEWRKLGPLDHTVPRAASAALVARLEGAVQRVEAPLRAARVQARAEREALVVRARVLADGGPGRDLVGEVRALQAEWQQHAKSLPLARGDEQALWADFKGAIDAAFAAREAVFSAREAEFETHASERVALIERLQLNPDASAAALRRVLAEVEATWQRCGPAPRARASALEAEFRAARDALRQWLDDSAQRHWQALCDALEAKLALCLAREEGGAAVMTEPWQALPVLPSPLEDALRRRAGLVPPSTADTAAPTDELLLQIESAWSLSTPPAFEAARRERKLLDMKAALEGRRAITAQTLSPEAALAQVLGRGGLGAEQRDRLGRVLSAWRQRGPPRRD